MILSTGGGPGKAFLPILGGSPSVSLRISPEVKAEDCPDSSLQFKRAPNQVAHSK